MVTLKAFNEESARAFLRVVSDMLSSMSQEKELQVKFPSDHFFRVFGGTSPGKDFEFSVILLLSTNRNLISALNEVIERFIAEMNLEGVHDITPKEFEVKGE